jgi:hypothetical protein
VASDLSITFAGTPGKIQSVSASEIKAVVPAGAKSGEIQISSVTDLFATSDKDFRLTNIFYT